MGSEKALAIAINDMIIREIFNEEKEVESKEESPVNAEDLKKI